MADPFLQIKQDLELAEECLAFPSELTEWEQNFLNNIIGRLKNPIQLSDRQRTVLKDLEKKLIERLD